MQGLTESELLQFNRLNDDDKLYKKFLNKKISARNMGIELTLTLSDILHLLDEAFIISSYWGFSGGHNWVLARYRDTGNYEVNNCRFITQKENASERKVSLSSAEAAMKNLSLATFSGQSHTPEAVIKMKAALERRFGKLRREKLEALHPSYRGNRNSQYGTCWITDGKIELKWHPSKGNFPDGFDRGRIVPL